jgi:lipid-A-disaccharide synthase
MHSKRIVIIAGEESGDLHAASIIKQLRSKHPNLHISGIGGRHMQKAGAELLSDLAKFGVTGITEVLRHLSSIHQAFKTIKAHLRAHKPDLLILVDYPGFNLRLARFAKTLGIRVLYYISPQIWAWKAGRIETIKRYVDHMAVILPFEKKIYLEAGVTVSFVGHPLVEKVSIDSNLSTLRNALELPQDKRLIAMLPGSRTNEILRHMPVLIESAKRLCAQYTDLHIVIPVASSLDPQQIEAYFAKSQIPHTLIRGHSIEIAACSDCVVVASGTASLECALLEKPMCIIYKSSTLSYIAAMKLVRVKFLGLCNLLQNQMIVPELLQYDCNPSELTQTIFNLLNEPAIIERMQARLHKLRLSLSSNKSDRSITSLIEHELLL